MLRKYLFALAMGMSLGLGAMAQDNASKQSPSGEIAAQKWDAEITGAFAKIKNMTADNAERMLQNMLKEIQGESALAEEKRKEFVEKVQKKLTSLGMKTGNPALDQPASNTSPTESERIQHEIRQELNAVRGLMQSGQNDAAGEKLRKLEGKYPNNSTIVAFREQRSRNIAVSDQKRIDNDKANGQRTALNSVNAASGNSTDSVKYDPERWKEISKPRIDKFNKSIANLSERETKIMQSLDAPLKKDFVVNDWSFKTILEELEKEIGHKPLISEQTMKDLNITYDQKLAAMTMPAGVTKRILLKTILAEFGLTYVMKNENLTVMSFLDAKKEIRAAVIDVRAFLSLNNSNPDELIRFIKTTVEPDSWDLNGGYGTITYVKSTHSLIIRNSAEVLYNLGGRTRK